MAKSTGLNQRFFVHGYDLSGDVGAIGGISTPRSVHDVTGLDKSAMERILGLADVQAAYDAFFNDAGDLWTELSALPIADRSMIWAFGPAIGDPGFGATVKHIDFPLSRGADGGLSSSPSAQGSAGAIPGWGEMLTTGKQTYASAANGDSLDGGAATSNGLVIDAQMFSLGSGTPSVEVEDSADDAAFSSIATLSDLTGAATAQRATVSGAIRRYLRVAISGTFTNAVVAVLIRRGTAEDIEDLS